MLPVFFFTDGKNVCSKCNRQWDTDLVEKLRPRPLSGRLAVAAPGTVTKKARTATETVKLTAKGVDVLKQGLPMPGGVTVVVLDVFRFIIDQQAKRALRIDADPAYATLKDGYDILVSDGETKCMVAVQPQLFAQFNKGLVLPFSYVKFTTWRQWYNDLELVNGSPTQVVLVSALEVLQPGYFPGINGPPQPPQGLGSLLKKPFSPHCNQLDGQTARPLFGSRNYFVNFFSDASVVFPSRDLTAPFDVSVEDVSGATFLGELAQSFLHPKKAKRANPLPTRVYGRVMRKSAVNHYAKAGDEKGAFPMNFSFFIADDSAEVRVVCWNNVCRNVYSSIDIGDVVVIDNFKPKHAFYDQPNKPLNNAPASRPELLELAVNPSGPVGNVWKVPENREIEQMYPLLDNNVFPLPKVALCADHSSVDIFGLIVFVGRVQVDQVARQSYSQWRQRECYRWIKIQDENGEELACKVYANTQWNTFQHDLVEGSVMFLKEFRVHSITPSARARDRMCWCSSSPYSRVFAIGDDLAYDQVLGGGLVAFVNKNRDEIDRLSELRDSQRSGLADTVVVPVMDLALYSEVFPRTEAMLLTDLGTIQVDLDFLEYRTYFLHHYIKRLTFDGTVQQITSLHNDRRGGARCVPVDRIVCTATVSDLNETCEDTFQVAFDTDEFAEIREPQVASLLQRFVENHGIKCDFGTAGPSMAALSQILWTQHVKFHSLLSLYRSSFGSVERCLYIANASK